MQHHKNQKKKFPQYDNYLNVFNDDSVWQVMDDLQENGFSRIVRVDTELQQLKE